MQPPTMHSLDCHNHVLIGPSYAWPAAVQGLRVSIHFGQAIVIVDDELEVCSSLVGCIVVVVWPASVYVLVSHIGHVHIVQPVKVCAL